MCTLYIRSIGISFPIDTIFPSFLTSNRQKLLQSQLIISLLFSYSYYLNIYLPIMSIITGMAFLAAVAMAVYLNVYDKETGSEGVSS